MRETREVVVDASAMIALLKEEPGAKRVEEHFGYLQLSSINAAETIFRMMRFISPNTLEPMLSDLVHIIPLTAEIAFLTARLKEMTKSYGLSYGDCACLALGKIRNLPVLTADKIWQKLDIGVDIIVIR